jgi:hypothetical protein
VALSASLMFRSERFDYKSELPDEYNAGNRFYGKDVANFLSANLTEQGFESDYLDEDWGWVVLSAKGGSPEFEVAVYNLAEHGEGGRPGIGEWGLWIRSFQRKKLLGLLPKRSEVQVPARLVAAVQFAIRAAGAEPKEWEEGPSAA